MKKIKDWERKISWGRVPQEDLKHLTTGGAFNFYREWVGRDSYRVIYEISNGEMTVVAVLKKDDDTYDNLDSLQGRMNL